MNTSHGLLYIIRKVLRNPYEVASKNGVKVKNTYLTRSFNIVKKNPRSCQRITIGEKCILRCELIFESQSGCISIGSGTYIGGNTKIISVADVEIGDWVTIGWDVTIYDHDSHSLDYRERMQDQERQLKDWRTGNFIATKDWSVVSKGKIRICDHAWIGFGSVILKGVTIGKGSVVGARSVVASDVMPWTVVAGNPARVIKELDKGKAIE